jgi:putative ABC transport system substrate-binding protein
MRAEALSVGVDPFFFDRASQIVVLAARHAVPALYFRREFAAVGGLMSYGSNADESYRVLGVYAGRILKRKTGRPTDSTANEVRAGD